MPVRRRKQRSNDDNDDGQWWLYSQTATLKRPCFNGTVLISLPIKVFFDISSSQTMATKTFALIDSLFGVGAVFGYDIHTPYL